MSSELSLLAELERLRRERVMSYAALGRELGISKTATIYLMHEGRWPGRVNRASLEKKIRLVISELKYKCGLGTRDDIIMEVDTMEHVSAGAQKRFGLKCDPFLNEIRSAADIYPMKEAEDACDFMEQVALYQGFGALIGEVGTGKTLLLRKLEGTLGERVRFVRVKSMDKLILKPVHLLEAIIYDLTGKYGGIGKSIEGKSRYMKKLLEEAAKEDARVCLVLDDAQQIPRATMKSLKQLYDYESGFRRYMGILLLGQLEMLDMMRDVRLRETTNRCGWFLMRGLVHTNQVEGYLKFKIERAGGDYGKIFEEGVAKEIGLRARYEYIRDGERMVLGPPLRAQNVAARLMNWTHEQNEGKVTVEILNVTMGKK